MMQNPIDYLLPRDEDPNAIRLYRLRVAVVACSAWMTLVFFVIPAMTTGLPNIGRIAWISDVEAQIKQVIVDRESYTVIDAQKGKELQIQVEMLAAALRDDRADRIEQGVFTAKMQQCQAILEKRSVIFWTEQLRRLLADYRRIMQVDVDVPTCSELL